MADIQSMASEIRRGKKKKKIEEEEEEEETTGQKYNGPLLHRAAIRKNKPQHENIYGLPIP